MPADKFEQDSAWAPNPQAKAEPQQGWMRWLPRISFNWLASLRWFLAIIGWVLAVILAGAIAERFNSRDEAVRLALLPRTKNRVN